MIGIAITSVLLVFYLVFTILEAKSGYCDLRLSVPKYLAQAFTWISIGAQSWKRESLLWRVCTVILVILPFISIAAALLKSKKNEN